MKRECNLGGTTISKKRETKNKKSKILLVEGSAGMRSRMNPIKTERQRDRVVMTFEKVSRE
jgi:dethiobiotin synthetase